MTGPGFRMLPGPLWHALHPHVLPSGDVLGGSPGPHLCNLRGIIKTPSPTGNSGRDRAPQSHPGPAHCGVMPSRSCSQAGSPE